MVSTKTSLRKEGATRTDLYYIDPTKILVDWEENPRKDYGSEEDMEFLINSIANEGVKVPIKVYSKEGELYLAHGFRRMKATLIAIERGEKIEKVPAQQVTNNVETILMDHFTLNSGKPMTVGEQSYTLAKLMKVSGMSQADVARRVGLFPSRVSVLIGFEDKASTPLKKAVQEGVIGFETATRLIRETEGIEAQNKALEEAIKITDQDNGGNKKRKASLKAVKKATGSKLLTPFERLVQVGDEVQGTEFGDRLNSILNMARKKREVSKIVDYLRDTIGE